MAKINSNRLIMIKEFLANDFYGKDCYEKYHSDEGLSDNWLYDKDYYEKDHSDRGLSDNWLYG